MSLKPVLRWAGSKRKLLPNLRSALPPTFERYIEPFAGSAVLFFDLLPEKAVLGDLNPEIIATYEAIRDDPNEVFELLTSIPLNGEAYYLLRSLNTNCLKTSERAARLIYLMKACFNGVYRTNKSGQFNVPIGSKFYSLPDLNQLRQLSSALSGVTLTCGDFEQSIKNTTEDDFVYIDPPYSDGTRFRGEYGYAGSFVKTDQERLVEVCRGLTDKGTKVLLSFRECEVLCDALKGWKLRQITVARSVAGFSHSRRQANEILASNY